MNLCQEPTEAVRPAPALAGDGFLFQFKQGSREARILGPSIRSLEPKALGRSAGGGKRPRRALLILQSLFHVGRLIRVDPMVQIWSDMALHPYGPLIMTSPVLHSFDSVLILRPHCSVCAYQISQAASTMQ